MRVALLSYAPRSGSKAGGNFSRSDAPVGYLPGFFASSFEAKNIGDTGAEREATRRGVLKKGPKGANTGFENFGDVQMSSARAVCAA